MSNPSDAPVPNTVTSNQQIVTYRVLPDGSGDPINQGLVPLDPNSGAVAYAHHGGGNVWLWDKDGQVWIVTKHRSLTLPPPSKPKTLQDNLANQVQGNLGENIDPNNQ